MMGDAHDRSTSLKFRKIPRRSQTTDSPSHLRAGLFHRPYPRARTSREGRELR